MEVSEKKLEPRAPGWSWAFVAACGAIPIVSLGGAIPGLVGALGAMTCYGLARDGKGTAGRRAFSCALVTLAAWGAFGTLAWAVTRGGGSRTIVEHRSGYGSSTTRTKFKNGKVVSREEGRRERISPDQLTDDERQEIYLDAIKTRVRIEEKKKQIEERLTSGRSATVLQRQLGTLEKMHESHLSFVASHNKLTRFELERIINEGDEADWDQ